MLYLWLQGKKITTLQHDVATVYHPPIMRSIFFYACTCIRRVGGQRIFALFDS